MSEATDWDAPVELVELDGEGGSAGSGGAMTLREAVDIFLSWPFDRQNKAAIRSEAPIAVRSGKHIVERFFLNGWGIRALAREEVRTVPHASRQLRHRRSRKPRATGIALATFSTSAVATALKAAFVGLLRLFN